MDTQIVCLQLMVIQWNINTIRPLDTLVPVVSYFFDDSDMDLDIDTKLLCHFEGNSTDPDKNFYINSRDTIPISIGHLILDLLQLPILQLQL